MPCQLMIIDDNENDLFFTRIALERCGVVYDVTSFDMAKNALTWLQSHPPPALILLDINMPEMDGFEFLDAFEALPMSVRGEIAIVMLSSSSDPADKARAAQFPAVCGYFIKPLDPKSAASLIDLKVATDGYSVHSPML